MTPPTVAEARDAVLRAAGRDVREFVEPELDALIAATRADTVHACITAVCDVRADRATARGPMYDCGDYRRRVLDALYNILEATND